VCTAEVWTHSRINWFDGDVIDFPPRIEVLDRRQGGALIRVVKRVMAKGDRYRTEFLDGSPSRIFDGSTGWAFHRFRSDIFYRAGPVIPVRIPRRPGHDYLNPFRPRPVPDGTEGMSALSIRRVDFRGREVVEEVRPIAPGRPGEPGYRNLYDARSGLLVRQTYGTDDLQAREWSEVTTGIDLDDDLFVWVGPSRGLEAGLAGLIPVTTTPTYLPVPVIADQLGLPVTKVHQLIRDGQLVAIRQDGVLRIPAEFVADGLVVKGLPATVTLLRDNGYRDDEIVAWLFEADDSLPGSPMQALRENRGREVHRRAQIAGF
jgi:hypothetical protein